ncbi:hypothetical protein RSOLAG1IB_07682 [Rhizoctonia solani AG-1 IB]|uniref:F-box domain-containing protein n=1 Tax=Thanatephorus cucumeris (strain AG1-IB / isolate 7/3/14) TaxID=1108050 RepID=A0A0B7FDZ6_THACB|nr:hypothetical protein RSOLAG1IB_07682 [Rhizoctonia solani AG-1 IB]
MSSEAFEELRVASDLLQIALDRYLNACLAMKHTITNGSSLSVRHRNITGSALDSEKVRIDVHETILRKSKLAIFYAANKSPNLVPISILPDEILVLVFQYLVDAIHIPANADSTETPAYPLLLSQTCTHWRQLIHRTSSLWSNFRINRGIGRNGFLSYLKFHTIQTKEAPMDISISEDLSSPELRVPNILSLVEPFTGRIESLRFRVVSFSGSENQRDRVARLLAGCLQAANGKLKRLTATTFYLYRGPNGNQHWIVESATNPPNGSSLGLPLSQEYFEDALLTVSSLWFDGLYFNWTSKLYHGLTSLRLDKNPTCSITEPLLVNILVASPRLQWLDVRINITDITTSPTPVYMPNLEVLISTDNMSLLQLIQPGSKELTLSIISRARASVVQFEQESVGNMGYDPRFTSFLSRANVVSFYGEGFLRGIVELLDLLLVAPKIRTLALSYFIHYTPFNRLAVPTSALDQLLILKGCRLECSVVRRIIETCGVKELVLSDKSITDSSERVIQNKFSFTEELSNSGNTHIRFVSSDDTSLLSKFVGPVIRS